MLRKLHLLRQPFAIAPIRSTSASNSIMQSIASATRASALQQTLLVPSPASPCLSFRAKHSIDTSLVPELSEDDLEETFIKGSGPGGSNVNKRTNCCQIRHIPTGIVVKCHLSRLLDENRKLARLMLIEKLDELYNGEMSVKAQKERLRVRKWEEGIRKSKIQSDRKKKYQQLLDSQPRSRPPNEHPGTAVETEI